MTLVVPRCPHTIVQSESPEMHDYEAADIKIIRANVPELKDHSDDEISCLYRWYSVEVRCAGWIGRDENAGRPGSIFRWFLESMEPHRWHEAWDYN